MRVRVVEAGEYRRAAEVDDAGPGTAKVHDLALPAGQNLAGRDREMGVGIQPCPPERADPPARQDQIGFHRPHPIGGFALIWRRPLISGLD